MKWFIFLEKKCMPIPQISKCNALRQVFSSDSSSDSSFFASIFHSQKDVYLLPRKPRWAPAHTFLAVCLLNGHSTTPVQIHVPVQSWLLPGLGMGQVELLYVAVCCAGIARIAFHCKEMVITFVSFGQRQLIYWTVILFTYIVVKYCGLTHNPDPEQVLTANFYSFIIVCHAF